MVEAQKLFKIMSEFDYGWIDKAGHKYINQIAKSKFITDYYLQNPKDIDTTKIGICWDQVEYERRFFLKNNIPHKSIFIVYDDGVKYPNHTFLIFKSNQKYYWFENTYSNVKGILEYNSLKDCLNHVKKEFLQENKLQNIDMPIYFFEYEQPKYGIGAIDFITHCQKGIKAKQNFENLDKWQ